jgi:hypothetical protein
VKLPGVLRDKRVQIGVAAAAGLGLIVLVRNRNNSGTATDTGAGSTPQQFSGSGLFDSTQTDTYNAIQSLGEGWKADLQDYTSKLDGLTTQVGALGTAVGQLGTVKAPGSTVKSPPINPSYKTGRGWVSVKPGQTVASIAKKYNTTEAAIRGLNSANALNRFSPGETIRIRGAAGPKPPGSK